MNCLISQYTWNVKTITCVRLSIFLHCENQLALAKYAQNIHIDATGGLVFAMQAEQKILVFSIMMDNDLYATQT